MYYRSWRSRGWDGSSRPSRYSSLVGMFGDAVGQIRSAFLSLDEDARNELFSDYGAIYGDSAERYARKTFPKWKSGATNLSGQTMERLVELVPPYLLPEQRFSILQNVLKHHKKSVSHRSIRINIKEPTAGFSELQSALASMSHGDVLAHLPEHVMKAASWLYDDDITGARAMLAKAERLENDMIRTKAAREIELLRKTISSGQIKTASYNVEMPAGKLDVIAYTPSKCFVATVCFGENAPETAALRGWRDDYLIKKAWGRKFIVWYYENGEALAEITARSSTLKYITMTFILFIVNFVTKKSHRNTK